MIELVREIKIYKHVLFMLSLRDIKVKYKQSVMGFLWAILMPMLIVAAGLLVRKGFSIVSGKPMVLSELASVTAKALPWAFFINSIRFATNSLTANTNLVTKIYFPREVFPISSVIVNLLDFAVAAVPTTFILAIMGVGISIQLFWLPLILTLLILLTLGIGIFLSCANLFFRDVKYIVDAIITFGIFFTPVFYEASMFGKWSSIILLNPMGALLEAINNVVVLHRQPDLFWLVYAASWSIIGFLITLKIFNKAEPAFAENI